MKYLKITGIVLVFLSLSSLPNQALGFGTLSLSQSTVGLAAGLNTTVTIYTSNNQMANVTNVTNAFVAYANISGNIMTIYGLGSGSTQITACTFDNSCATVYVTVTGTGSNNYNGNLTFSQSSVSLNQNQNITISIYNSNNSYSSYYISNNSNSNVVSASISGNSLNLYGNNTGASNITVCSNYGNICGTVYVTVNNNNYSSITFSQSTVNLNPNLSTSVTIYGSGSFYISNNSSPSVVTASISGSILNIYANSVGSSSITVCTNNYSNTCGTVYTTVNPYYPRSNNGRVLGTSIYGSGTLINDSGTIFITYKNSKAGFASMNAFSQLGFKLNNVINGSTSMLTDSEYIINSGSNAHPWGSWIKNGNTVYFVHETGLIPIDNYNVFIQNGGLDKMVVMANLADFTKPLLYNMTLDDSRLK